MARDLESTPLSSLGLLFRRFGSDDHRHLPTFEPASGLDLADISQILSHLVENFDTQVRPPKLPVPEEDRDFDLLAFLEESTCAFGLDIEVVGIDRRSVFDLLDLHLNRLLLRFLGALVSIEPRLAPVENANDWWIRISADFDEIESFGLRQYFGLI